MQEPQRDESCIPKSILFRYIPDMNSLLSRYDLRILAILNSKSIFSSGSMEKVRSGSEIGFSAGVYIKVFFLNLEDLTESSEACISQEFWSV